MFRLVLAALLIATSAGCATGSAPSVRGPAHLVSTGDSLLLRHCATGQRYEVDMTTSNAAPSWDEAVQRAREAGEVYVDVNGFESTSPSNSVGAASEADGVMSVGWIRTLEARPDGC